MRLKILVLEQIKGKKRLSRRKCPVKYLLFKEIIESSIKEINLNNENNIRSKYDFYILQFDKLIRKMGTFYPSDFGFCPNKLSISYFTDRGWDEKYAKSRISEFQSKTSLGSFIKRYGEIDGNKKFEDYVNKKSKSFSSNYKKGYHKKFYRPSQKEFWIEKNQDPSIGMINMFRQPSLDFHKKIKEVGNKWLTCRQIDFWVEKGYSYSKAAEKLKEVQDNRSLESLIQKYGKKKGKIKFDQINNKWLKTLNSKSDEEKLKINLSKFKNNRFFSKSSKDFFEILIKEFDCRNIKYGKILYANKEYFIYDEENKKINFYDFYSYKLNLIIEYNGILFHPNKEKLSIEEWKKWKNPYNGESAYEKYKKDQYKINLAKSKNHNIIEIWENETLTESISKIIKFISK
jgi:hypothetical protein